MLKLIQTDNTALYKNSGGISSDFGQGILNVKIDTLLSRIHKQYT